jgi:predicted PurR-regulated permease PerM
MSEKLEQFTFLITLVLVSIAFGYMVVPFWAPLLWACIIAVLFPPVKVWLQGRWGDRPNSIALVTLLACVVLVVIPVLLIFASFLQQAIGVYEQIEAGELQPGKYVEQVRTAFPALQSMLERFDIDMGTLRERAGEAAVTGSQFLARNALAFGQGAFGFVLQLALMLYVTFFLLRDGQRLIEMLIEALPLGDERERLLFQKFAEVARATVKGNLLVAMVQGMLGGLIFALLGLPAPVLWGVLMTALSLIPAVGAGLVWLPAAVYLYAIGEWVSASVLIAYGVLIIGLADNILRPILVGRDTKLPDWMVLLSTLGGIVMVGINGFVVGPLIAVLFVAFWQIFMREFHPQRPEDVRPDAATPADSD